MFSTTDSPLNSAGLEPEKSKALEERHVQQHEEPIIMAIKEMYSCKPKDNTFDIYAGGAVFHDPIGIANGVNSIRSQFVGLAKIFSRSDIPKFRVLQNPSTVPPNTILIDQDVAYFLNAKSSSPTKVVNSLLTLKIDDANKVIRHTEEWDHQKTTTDRDGFLGLLNEQRKKLTASLTDMLVSGREKKN